MSPIYPIIILFLLTSAASSQLAPDRDRFDIQLHPGEVEEKIVTLTNVGDKPIFDIRTTPVGGSAKDFILIEIPDFDYMDLEDEEEMSIIFIVPPETKPDTYTGYVYLFDDTPPSIPIVIEFNLLVTEEESYGVSFSIDDARIALAIADPDKPAEFDLSVRNTGRFRDVMSIDSTFVPDGWSISLFDDDTPVELPYKLPLNSGTDHLMTLKVDGNPGEIGEIEMTATSLGNRSKNATVNALVEVGLAVRGYSVAMDVPEVMVVNRSYSTSFSLILMKTERINIDVVAPPEVMVIPLTQAFSVSEEKAGIANFTMIITQPGEYKVAFNMVDSNGVPLPEETILLRAVEPSNTLILTGEDFVYSTVASLSRPDNRTLPVITVPLKGLSEEALEEVMSYKKVLILGDDSVVPSGVEEDLKELDVERIAGQNLWETTWLFTKALWINGTAEVVISGPGEIDIFKAYRQAQELHLPLIVCDSEMTEVSRSAIEELKGREVSLSKAIVVGKVFDSVVEALGEMGLETEVSE